MRAIRTAFWLCAAGLLLPTAHGTVPDIAELRAKLKKDPGNLALLMQVARHYHDIMALGRNLKAYKLGEKYLRTAMSVAPKNPLPLALAGSLRCFRARDMAFEDSGIIVRWSSPKYFGEGEGMMDRAVRMAPKDLRLRLIRADNALILKRAGRLTTAIKDYQLIIKAFEEKDGRAAALKMQRVYFNCGKAYQLKGDVAKARPLWEKAVKLAPDSELGAEAKTLLDEEPAGPAMETLGDAEQ